MSKVVIQGDADGTGIFTIAAPNSNTNRALTLPDATGTVDRLERAGNILQVVQARKTDTSWSTTSTTFQAVTDLSVTITPTSSSSKFLITASVSVGANWWTSPGGYFGIQANGTSIAGDGGNIWVLQYGADSGNSLYETMQWSEEVLYAPSTTLPITFNVALATQNASYSLHVNRNHGNTAKRGNSWITVMEIAG